MAGELVQVDYAFLERIASFFAQESERVNGALKTLRRQMDSLQQGGWIGRGANAFYSEMEQSILPSLQRLGTALEISGVTVKQMMQVYQSAEIEARRLFEGGASGVIGLAVGSDLETMARDFMGGVGGNVMGGIGATLPAFVNAQAGQAQGLMIALSGVMSNYVSGLHLATIAIAARWAGSQSTSLGQMIAMAVAWQRPVGGLAMGVQELLAPPIRTAVEAIIGARAILGCALDIVSEGKVRLPVPGLSRGLSRWLDWGSPR